MEIGKVGHFSGLAQYAAHELESCTVSLRTDISGHLLHL